MTRVKERRRRARRAEERWERWKERAAPQDLAQAWIVTNCVVCSLRPQHATYVRGAFMAPARPPWRPLKLSKALHFHYARMKHAVPDRGPRAMAFVAAFRAEHGHNPSRGDVADHFGWREARFGAPVDRLLWQYAVDRLIARGWILSSGRPWGLTAGSNVPIPAQAGEPGAVSAS
ncbi:hypothetical protein ACWC5I_41585 [Kitasatospora sp. NPDC001574]